MLFKFTVVLRPGDIARLRFSFIAITNNLKLTNRNGGKNNATKIATNTAEEITILLLEIIDMTVVVMSNVARRANSLRLVTDLR